MQDNENSYTQRYNQQDSSSIINQHKNQRIIYDDMNKHHNINNLNKILIETLLSQKAISREGYERAWPLHKAQNETTNTILTTLGITSEKDIADTLASLMGSVVVELKTESMCLLKQGCHR